MNTLTPFSFVKAASETKENIMDDETKAQYKPWVINLAFSMNPDTILHANLMNMYHDLPVEHQFEFYLNSLRAKKRYNKWAKAKYDEDLGIVCRYYNCNYNVGRKYISLMSDEQLNEIRQKEKTGGMNDE